MLANASGVTGLDHSLLAQAAQLLLLVIHRDVRDLLSTCVR